MIPTSQARADSILERLGFPNPKVAEIGVLAGTLSARLLNRTDLRLTMVDNWLGADAQPAAYRDSADPTSEYSQPTQDFNYREAIRRTEFASMRRAVHHMDSVTAARETPDASLDLVFIDARHDYEGVREDIEAWAAKVKPGGWLSGHDYDHDKYPQWGVKRAVDEFASSNNLAVELGQDYTWFIRMPGDAPQHDSKWCHHGELVVACVMVDNFEGRGEEYVRILQDQVQRNLRDHPYRFVCLSDRLIEGVECGYVQHELHGWWAKLYAFAAFPNQRVLYFDLDTVIVGPLEPILDKLNGVPFAALHDWYRLDEINSAMMYWEGDHSDIYTNWLKAGAPTTFQRSFGDQAWIMLERPDAARITVLCPDAVKSYKAHDLDAGVPAGVSVIAFHGRPRPHELTNWVKDFWRIGGMFTPRWQPFLNNSDAEILANVKTNQARPGRNVVLKPPNERPVVLCCGGPSIGNYLDGIREMQAHGFEVWAVNGVADYLAENGIIANVHVLLDSREWNVRFVENSRDQTHYLVASQVHPKVFDALEAKGRWIDRWDATHPGVNAELLILGGATVSNKAICVALVLGYREFHVFGMDSSYPEGEAHHAYTQPENDEQLTVKITAAGREFLCPRWGATQARDLMGMMPEFLAAGASFDFYGDGLIQWCMKNMVKDTSEEAK